MEVKNYGVDPEVTEENGSTLIAEEAVEAKNEAGATVTEESRDGNVTQPVQLSGKGKGRRYARAEIVNSLRRAREEHGGRIPSQAEFKKIDYLPSWATVTKTLGPFTGWPAILDGAELPSETGGVTSVEKAQSGGRAKVAHRFETETSPRAMKVTLEFRDGEVYVQATKNVEIELATDDGEHFSVGLRW